MRKTGLLLSLALAVGGLLTACGNSSSSSEEVAPVVIIDDMVLKVGDVAAIEPVFNPASAADSLEYSIPEEGKGFISIRNSVVTALAKGVTTVTAKGKNTTIETTFTVTVDARSGVEGPLAEFNEAGTFENGLGYFTITGASSEGATTEVDADRGQEDMQFKLWTGAAVDYTISARIAGLEKGLYTFSFELVAGAMDAISARINSAVYSWAAGDIKVSGVNYVKSYLVYDLAADGNIDFSLTFSAADRAAGETFGWGYLDNLKAEKGDTSPNYVPQPKNYVLDSSFETGTDFASTWILSGTYNGTLNYSGSDSAHSGNRGLNYWSGANITSDTMTLKQTISGSAIDAGANYKLVFHILNGDDKGTKTLPESYIYIKQGNLELKRDLKTITGYNAGWQPYKIEDFELVPGLDVEIGYVFTNTSQGYWAHMDDFQLLNPDILV